MNRSITFAALTASLFAATLAAQSSGMADKRGSMSKAGSMDKLSAERTYTGCLQAGNAPSTFILKGAQPMAGKPMLKTQKMDKMENMADGTSKQMTPDTMTLIGTAVHLETHVGQKVSVTGAPAAAMKDAMGREESPFRVRTLKTLAKSCS